MACRGFAAALAELVAPLPNYQVPGLRRPIWRPYRWFRPERDSDLRRVHCSCRVSCRGSGQHREVALRVGLSASEGAAGAAARQAAGGRMATGMNRGLAATWPGDSIGVDLRPDVHLLVHQNKRLRHRDQFRHFEPDKHLSRAKHEHAQRCLQLVIRPVGIRTTEHTILADALGDCGSIHGHLRGMGRVHFRQDSRPNSVWQRFHVHRGPRGVPTGGRS